MRPFRQHGGVVSYRNAVDGCTDVFCSEIQKVHILFRSVAVVQRDFKASQRKKESFYLCKI